MSAPRRLLLGLLAGASLTALAAVAAARQAGTLDSLFPWRAPVSVEDAGTPGRLARLFLTADVLRSVRPDLSDLRMLDASGRDVAYAVDREAGLRRRVGALDTAEARIRSASQSRSQRDESTIVWSESYELGPPPQAWSADSRNARRFLRVVSDHRRFVKRLKVAGIDGATRIDDASLFRLPDPVRESVRFELPPGTREVRVEMVGEDGGWLEPTFLWERETDLAERPEPATVDLPLVEISRRREDGETILLFERPRGLAPLAVVLDTTTPLLRRRVSLFDAGAGVPRRALLEGEIRRVGTGESRLTLDWPAAARPLGGELEVRVLDQDSPALDDLEVALRLAQPALLFATDAGPTRLVWGGARVRAPRYDVDALVPALPASGEAAELGRAVLDDDALVEARLGPAEPNPGFDPVSPLEFAMAAGREIDPRRFSHARPLTAGGAPLGLYRLTLSAADQAVLRPDLGDLRIVDAESRQRPYVLVLGSGRERARATIRASHPEGETVLRLELPSSPITVAGLLLEVEDSFFERAYSVLARVEGSSETETLTRGSLRRERSVDGTVADRSVEIVLPERRVTSLEVRIADGSDRPLAITAAEIETPAPEVLFPAPDGEYTALLGEPDLGAPRYELEAVRGLVQALDSTPVEAGALEPNEDFSLGARLRRGSGLERTLLAIALVVAVLVLTVVTLRLAGPTTSPERAADGREHVRNSSDGADREDSTKGS